MRVSPEPKVIEPLKMYRDGLNYVIRWIIKHSERNWKKRRAPSLSTIHGNLYEKLNLSGFHPGSLQIAVGKPWR